MFPANFDVFFLLQLSYLSAMEISIALASSMVVLPAASYIMTARFHIGVMARDLTITRACALLIIIGAAFVIFAPNSTFVLVGMYSIGLHFG